jgi:hypothetical protein
MVNGARLALVNTAAISEGQRGDQQRDARIGELETALREASLRTEIGKLPANDNDRMELGFDPKSGIWRAIGSVPGETNEERLQRELDEARARKVPAPASEQRASSDDEIRRRVVKSGDRIVGAPEIFNRYQGQPDVAALDEAYQREQSYDPLESSDTKRKRKAGGSR